MPCIFLARLTTHTYGFQFSRRCLRGLFLITCCTRTHAGSTWTRTFLSIGGITHAPNCIVCNQLMQWALQAVVDYATGNDACAAQQSSAPLVLTGLYNLMLRIRKIARRRDPYDVE